MRNASSLLNRAVLAVASVVALGACNRAEYAVLPKSPAYLGSQPVAVAPRPVAHPEATAATPVTPVAPVPAAPAAVVLPSHVAAAVPEARTTPLASTSPAAGAATSVAPAATVAPTAPTLNLVQRLALKKINKKLDKLASQAPQLKKKDATASTSRIDGNLRTGIILIVVGLLVGLLNGVIGTIIAIIGLVFIVLWLLDVL